MKLMPVRPLLMILVSAVLGASGQIALKHGMSGVSRGAAGLWPWLVSTFTAPFVLLGLLCYVVSVTIWLAVLQCVDLSYGYPLADISTGAVRVAFRRVPHAAAGGGDPGDLRRGGPGGAGLNR